MRLKIIGANFLVVLVCGLAAFLLVRSNLTSTFTSDVEAALSRDQILFEDSRTAATRLLENLTRQRARAQSIVKVYEIPTASEDDRRRAAFAEAQAVSVALEDRGQMGRRPELVAVTDERGRIIARNVDPNVSYMRDLGTEFPSSRFALRGDCVTDIWQYDTLVLDAAACPVVREGRVVGSLVVGFDISNGQAKSDRTRFGREVGYFMKGKLYSSSLDGATASGTGGPAQQMATAVAANLAQAISTQTPSNRFPVTIGDEDYLAIVAPLPGQINTHDGAYVMMASVTQALRPVGATTSIIICTILGLILVAVVGLLLSNHFLKPIEQIEDGVLRVINGDVNHRLEIESAEVGGLAYRINQLINTLTGVEETDEEGGDEGGSRGGAAPPRPTTGPGGGGGGMAAAAPMAGGDGLSVAEASAAAGVDTAQLAAEPEANYYARVFKEYLDAKRSLGERVDQITQDKFLDKLKASEKSLAQKYGVPTVRFQVAVSGNTVSLRPVPLR